MHGRQRAAQGDTDPCDVDRVERAALLELCCQRLAVDELHPDADATVDALGSVDDDHVRVADAGEEPAFVDDRATQLALDGCAVTQELERDLAIEARVPGAIDVAVGAVPDLLDDGQRTPDDTGVVIGFTRASLRVQQRIVFAPLVEAFDRRHRSLVSARDGFEQLKPVDQGRRRLRRRQSEIGPIDRGAIGDGKRGIEEAPLVRILVQGHDGAA